jgi:hypothetical protein
LIDLLIKDNPIIQVDKSEWYNSLAEPRPAETSGTNSSRKQELASPESHIIKVGEESNSSRAFEKFIKGDLKSPPFVE